MSQNTDIKDKVIIDPSKIKGLQDILSRAEPGDKFDFSGTCSLDESGEKTATFSLVKVELETLEEDAAEGDAGEKVEAESQSSAAAKLFSGGKETGDSEAGFNAEK